MTFDDLPLYEAIYDTKRDHPKLPGDPVISSDRDDVMRAVCEYLPIPCRYSVDDIMRAWVQYRKSGGNSELTVRVAKMHGRRCFMRGRGKGECSSLVHLDRIVPGCRGGEYTVENCVLLCSTHNVSRGGRSIEEYLSP